MDTINPVKTKSLYVINSTSLIRRKYYQIQQQSNFLIKKQEEASIYIQSFPQLLCDMFCSLYLPYPTVKNWREINPNSLINMTILEGFLESDFYKNIRDKTCVNETASLWATEILTDNLMKSFSKPKWRKYFKKFYDKYGNEDDITVFLKNKKSIFSWLPFLKRTEEKEIIKFEKELKKIFRKVSKVTIRTAKTVSKNIGYVKNIIEVYQEQSSINNDTPINLSYYEKMNLAEKLKNNKRLRELAKIIGHLRQLALSSRYTKISSLPHETYDIVLGDDLSKINPIEITYLTHPGFQYDFYQRIAYKKLLQFELKGMDSKNQGSIIVCVDTSGSMFGQPEIMAKGVALGLLEIARIDKRNFVSIIFGQKNKVKTFIFKQDEVEIHSPEEVRNVKFMEGLMEFATGFIGGGTDFETPLRTAFSFKEKDEFFQDADFVFITDDICDISNEFVQNFNLLKKEKQLKVYGILIGPKSQQPGIMRKFCDEILNYNVLTDEIASAIFEKVSFRK